MSFFRRSHLMRLKNQEFSVAFNGIISLLDPQEVTVEYVQKALDEALEESAKLVELRNMRRKHHLTKVITELIYQRNDYLTSLTATIRGLLKSPFEDTRKAAEVLNDWLDAYREPLSKARLVQQTSLTEQLMDDVESHKRLSDAITTLDMLELFQVITASTQNIKTHTKARAKDMAANRRKAQELKQSAYEKLMVLFDAITMAIKLNDGDRVLYVRYVREINQLLNFYMATVLSRTTRNKTAADKKQQDKMEKEDEGDEGEEEENDPTATSSNMGMGGRSSYNILRLDADEDIDEWDDAEEEFLEEDELEMQTNADEYEELDDELEGELSEQLDHNLNGDFEADAAD